MEDVVERWPSIRSRVHDILHRLPSRREVDDGGGSPDTNIRRLGHLAAEITKSGGIAICASIAPYARLREDVRAMIAPLGGFVLVHMATPLDVCERRDPKGLYARARAGLIQAFTGISDPYEPPDGAEIVLDATYGTPEDAARRIIDYLDAQGYLEPTRG